MSTMTLDEIVLLPPEEMQQEYLKMTPGQRAEFMRSAVLPNPPEILTTPTRPRGGQRVVFNASEIKARINREFLARFDALAKEEGKSREAKIRELMDLFVEAHGAGAGLPTAAGLDRT